METNIASATNVSDPERWVSVVAGAAIAAFGLSRRSVGGIALAVVGGGLVWRGASGHCNVYESLGISTATDGGRESAVSVPYGRGVRVDEAVTINVPAEHLFTFWRNFANLPKFMDHLQSVTVYDNLRSHWVTKGPAGLSVEWDAEVINEVPNELIGWRSVEGSQVDNAGSVHFTRTTNGGTNVRVVLRYDPPAGKAGVAFAKVLGEDAAHQVRAELATFKAMMEGTLPV
jgi:uncharacterized membrane protein